MNVVFSEKIELPEIKLVGSPIQCSVNESENYVACTKLWQAFNKELHMIPHRINKDKWQKFGLYYGSNSRTFQYASCIPVSEFADVPPHFIQKVIPSCKYLEFIHTGSIQFIFPSIKYIYLTILKNMNVKPSHPESIGFNHFEEYGKSFNWTKSYSKLKILVPIE